MVDSSHSADKSNDEDNIKKQSDGTTTKESAISKEENKYIDSVKGQDDTSNAYERLVHSLEKKSEQDRELLASLLYFQQKEKKISRRWGIFFKMVFLSIFVVFFLLLLLPSNSTPTATSGKPGYAALIDVQGPIAQSEDASAERINTSMQLAASDKRISVIIIRINSPGGSPVQANFIYNEIKKIKKLNPDLKIYAVITDIGASAAYYIASAADEIYADSSSLVGSIGAYMASFGLDKAIEKIGITRRFYKSGEYKGFSDPFQPENAVAAEHLTKTIQTVHKNFIKKVKEGRGERLKKDPIIFSGLIWSGIDAKDLGLVDGIASPKQIAKDKLGTDDLVSFSPQLKPWEKLAKDIGISATKYLVSLISSPTIQ